MNLGCPFELALPLQNRTNHAALQFTLRKHVIFYIYFMLGGRIQKLKLECLELSIELVFDYN